MPDQLKVARVTGATLGSDLPARFSELETAISVITGIPLDVLINNPMTEVVAAGLRKILLQNLGADPTAPGQLSRNGTALRYFDAASRTVLHSGNRQFRAKMINEVYGVPNVMQQDNELVLPLEAGAFYEFNVSVYYVPAASNALGFQMTAPPGATALWNALGHFENSSFGSMPLATSSISSILITSLSASALTLWIQG